jgi:hypothetical protein
LDLDRFHRDLLVKTYFAGLQDEDFKPDLYIRSDWTPPLHEIPEKCTERFNNTLRHFSSHIPAYNKYRGTNLSPFQRNLLSALQNHPSLMVMKTDKNLGPAIIDRQQYLDHAFQDHLSNTDVYQRLHPIAATMHVNNLTTKLQTFFELNFPDKHPDRTFLSRSLEKVTDPYAYFYLLAKIHKDPWTTRPIVSVSGSLLEGLGKWIDRQLQAICNKLPYIFRSSYAVKESIDTLLNHTQLHPQATLFTADAVSMYTNIDTTHALDSISNFLKNSHPEIPAELEIEVDTLLSGLDIIMNNTVFKLGNTCYIQQSGTAMGSPAAPMYATLYFAIHEMTIIPKYKNIIFYGRYIDDALGIWLPDTSTDDTEDEHIFADFKKDFSSFGHLTWEFSNLSTTTDFLDITLTIRGNKVLVSPYEKSLNLYLYIPPKSAHPPHGLRSLISGRITHMRRITSCQETLQEYLRKLKLRLLAVPVSLGLLA